MKPGGPQIWIWDRPEADRGTRQHLPPPQGAETKAQEGALRQGGPNWGGSKFESRCTQDLISKFEPWSPQTPSLISCWEPSSTGQWCPDAGFTPVRVPTTQGSPHTQNQRRSKTDQFPKKQTLSCIAKPKALSFQTQKNPGPQIPPNRDLQNVKHGILRVPRSGHPQNGEPPRATGGSRC